MPNSRKIHAAELKVGMFVSRLDRDWLDTPFLLQGFHIEVEQDIDVVISHCEYVWVDDDKAVEEKGTDYSSGIGSALNVMVDPNIFAPEVPLAEEHNRILGAFKQARTITKSLLDEFRLGGVVDTDIAKETVNHCVDSIIRHPDALLWMSKMRDENEYTSEHCLNVCILSVAFGRQLGLSQEELNKLGMCALLHDVGKMRIPPHILNKPDTLTRKEMQIMKAHTVHGHNLLMGSKGLYDSVVDVAYSHHERVDGTGYPRGLPESGISKFTRIVAIVDAYDAMTAERCYQPAKTSTEVMKIIYEERGTHFDEELTLKFIRILGLYPAGSIVELHSGEVGMVIEANPKYRHLPKVLMMRDSEKKPLEKEYMIDLSLVESGELSKDSLVKRVWKDKSFDIESKNYLERGLFLS